MKIDVSRGHRTRVAWGAALLVFTLSSVSFASTAPATPPAHQVADDLPVRHPVDLHLEPAASLARMSGTALGLPLDGTVEVSQAGLLAERLHRYAVDVADEVVRSRRPESRRCLPWSAASTSVVDVARLMRPMSAFLAMDTDVDAVVDAWLRSAGLGRVANVGRPACAVQDKAGSRVLAEEGVLPTRTL